MSAFKKANLLLKEFKGDAYLHGLHVLLKVGDVTQGLGKRAALVLDAFPGSVEFTGQIRDSLKRANVVVLGEIAGAAPNCPREDLFRITEELLRLKPDVVISFGGGSTIDATKGAIVLAVLGGTIEDYFGTGLVARKLAESGKTLLPHIAIQTASSSSAHLTKYSNITDVLTGQKKLIVDDAIVPKRAIFDYIVTLGAPLSLTADGALDGISHALEVLYSAVGKPSYEKVLPVALEAIRLVLTYLPKALANPKDVDARQALGLATDLGGYCIMIGGTNGAHLSSFSLIDILSHGRACGMLNPYYTVFFAPAIENALRQVADIYRQLDYMKADPNQLSGRALGLAVAEAMIVFEQSIDFPVNLSQVPGFTDGHIQRALIAAKNPQLKMKLDNMPVPMTAEMVDEFMGPILQAAKTGNLELIKNVN
jgi:alcohol dehydrogenase class IV